MPVDRFQYKYECPTERGFKKFTISKRDQNRIFKYRKSKWSCKYEFYLLDKTIIMFKLPSKLFCILTTLLLPVSILLLGVMNYKRIYRESVIDTWRAKEQGAFSQDAIHKRDGDDGTFDELISCAKWD